MRIETPLRGIVEHNRPQYYDVLVVLGGNIRYENGVYRSTDWSIGPEKSRGGHWRIKAAAELVRQGKVGKIIFSTGITHSDPFAPSEAEVMYREFLGEFPDSEQLKNIPIELEIGSLSTTENANRTVGLLKGDFYKSDQVIGILTSSYHLPRARLMFAKEFETQKLDKSIALVSAEKILLEAEKSGRASSEIENIIRAVYTAKEMQGRILNERRGIRDFLNNDYHPLPPG